MNRWLGSQNWKPGYCTFQKQCEKYHFTTWQCRVSAGRDQVFKECKAQYVWEIELEKEFMKMILHIEVIIF